MALKKSENNSISKEVSPAAAGKEIASGAWTLFEGEARRDNAGSPASWCSVHEATHFLPVPYRRALKMIREAIKKEHLRIPMEMDVSGRIRAELGINLKPRRILYVDSSVLLLQATVWSGSGAGFLPLRAVVSQCASGTTVQLAGPVDAGLPAGLRTPFVQLLGRFLGVLRRIGAQRIGTRQSAAGSRLSHFERSHYGAAFMPDSDYRPADR